MFGPSTIAFSDLSTLGSTHVWTAIDWKSCSTNKPACYTTDMPRRIHIAMSIVIGVIAVALCILWLRSYKVGDVAFRGHPNRLIINISSADGYLHFDRRYPPHFGGLYSSNQPGWHLIQVRSFYRDPNLRYLPSINPHPRRVSVPYWFLTAPFAITSLLVWFPRSSRFSLRTLFIATTVLAVVLGFGVWLAR